MPRVAKLSADLFANTSRFESGMKRAKLSFKGFSKTVKTGAKAASVAIAGVSVVLGALTMRQAGVIDETAKLSKALGVNIREFQALVLVANEAGITQDKMGNIITKSQKAITEAARGLKTYERSFETLNINAKELIKLSPEEQFNEIARALIKVDNNTIRTATALEIFGKSGRDVNNMLSGFVDHLDDARAFNDKFGISLNKIDAAKVEEANDKFARVKKSITGLGNVLAVQTAPIITAISENFLDSGFSAVTFAKTVNNAMAAVAGAVDIVRAGVLGLRAIFNDTMLSIDKMTLNTTTTLFKMVGVLRRVPLYRDAFSGLSQDILDINRKAEKSAENNLKMVEKLNKEAEDFKSLSDAIKNIQIEAAERAKTATKDNTGGQISINKLLDETEEKTKKLTDAQKKAKKEVDALGNSFTNAFQSAVSGGNKFSDVLKNLARDIEKLLFKKVVSDPLTDAIKGALGGAKSDGGIFGKVLSFLPSLPSFASGIDFVPQDMTANIHEGERVLTANENKMFSSGALGGGSNVNVIINNNAGADIATSAETTGDGTQLNILVDQAVADNINRKGTRTNQAMNNFANAGSRRR